MDTISRPAPAAACRGTILLVEDEPALLRMGAAVLREQGFRVIEAASGTAALDAARAEPGTIDLIVSDVAMPGLDGPHVIAALRHSRPGIPALLVSGNPLDPARRPSAAGQRTEFLAKPFLPAQLIRQVRDLLNLPAA